MNKRSYINSGGELIISGFYFMKSRQLKDVGRSALGPGIFNVNEPVIFGMPMVLNAAIFIPWIITPLIVTTFNYLVMAAAIVPASTGVSVPWTVLIFILATNSILGGVLQLVDIAIVGVLWFPFLKLIDRINLNQTL